LVGGFEEPRLVGGRLSIGIVDAQVSLEDMEMAIG
jgi:hypothetical protein